MIPEIAAELTKPDTGLLILMAVGNIVAIVGTGVGVAWKMRDKIDSKVREMKDDVESSLDKKIEDLKRTFENQNHQNRTEYEKRDDDLKRQVEKNREEFQIFKADFPRILNGTYTRSGVCDERHDSMKEHFDDLKTAVAEVRRELREYAGRQN